jgi:hypothetical protein
MVGILCRAGASLLAAGIALGSMDVPHVHP